MLEEVTLLMECKLLSSQVLCYVIKEYFSGFMDGKVPSFRWDLTPTLLVARIPEVTCSLQAQLGFAQLSGI